MRQDRAVRSLAVGALAAALVGVGGSPAWAGEAGTDDGGWVPVETVIPDYYAAFDVQACGDTITVEGGDVQEVETRSTTLPDGTVLNEYRGAATLDLTRQSDGAMIDELDAGGPGHERISPDGTYAEVTLVGPSALFPYPGEEALFEAAGLYDLTYYEDGEVTLHITTDPATGMTSALTADIDTDHLIDLCAEFDHGDDCHYGER